MDSDDKAIIWLCIIGGVVFTTLMFLVALVPSEAHKLMIECLKTHTVQECKDLK